MKRHPVTVVLCAASLIGNGMAFSQSAWEAKGHTATLTRIFPEAKNAYGTAIIDWDPSSKCLPTVGIAITQGSALGSYKRGQKASQNMTVAIKGVQWSDSTVIAEYTGGFEVMMYAPPDLLTAMKSADLIEIAAFKGSMRFGFPLNGAAQAINFAKLKCK